MKGEARWVVVGAVVWSVLVGPAASANGGSRPAEGGPTIELPGGIDPSRSAADQRIGRADPTTLGGYAELVFNAIEDGDNKVDFRRFILFIAHRFTDWITLYAEVEFEHASQIEMEQAYIELRVADGLSVVAGLVLVPVGLTNLWHEPPLYHGADRPRVDRVILPSTWREAGIGLVYRPVDWITVEAYAMTSLDALGFSSASGIRGGRQSVSQATANDVAGAFRILFEPVLGLAIGVSGYYGGADQDQLGDTQVDVGIAAADAMYRNHGVELRAQFASVWVSNARELSAVLEETIGEVLIGWYIELGYDLLETLAAEHEVVPFVRYEQYDTQASVAEGLARSEDLNRRDITLGVSYRPVPTVVFKFDYQIRDSAGGDLPNQWDLGFGWMF